tara:strand:- start:2462 stop:2617 length:156 start_codon:yes stop_codon:yes gene_type:complete
MSKIEELVYNAYEHGQRTQLFEQVSKLRREKPNKTLEDIYEEAYSIIMKTQ